MWGREGGGGRVFFLSLLLALGDYCFVLLCFFSDLVLSLLVHAEAFLSCHFGGRRWMVHRVGVDWGWSWGQSSFMSVGCVYVCLSHIIAYDDDLLDERRSTL